MNDEKTLWAIAKTRDRLRSDRESMSEKNEYPEVLDLRDRMKHYEFRRDENNLNLVIRHFQVEDNERLRFTLSPCFNHVMMVLDTGPESKVQHIANLYPPIRSRFSGSSGDDEEYIYEYEYGMNVRDGALSIRFRIVQGLRDLPKRYWEHWYKTIKSEESETPVIVLKEVGEIGFRERFELRVSSNVFDLGDPTGGKAFEKVWNIHSESLGNATYKERDAFLEEVQRAIVEVVDGIIESKKG